ncbi:MAG: carboxy-S-adenosyl-L-methionine synthase CmoA [Proteobacteria bacterium]|nr:carboxy-S-adenosyl-L-methionine synthase CmoA [Pseudomonadota bacterium]
MAETRNLVACPRDELFADECKRATDFDFGKKTAAVFDDMLGRSVPFYAEIQRMTAELVSDFVTSGDQIYDLGCSTCNTFLEIDSRLDSAMHVRFVGLDSSQEMLDKARAKLVASGFRHNYELRLADLDESPEVRDANVVILTLTLQFVRPIYRERLLQEIFDGLNAGGVLILVEKVLGEHSIYNRLFIDHYYEFKQRQGYSRLEISQKREALENVLIPYRHSENVALLRHVGFQQIDTFFRWYNFCAMAAMK